VGFYDYAADDHQLACPSFPYPEWPGLAWPQKTTAITLTLLGNVNVGIAVIVTVAVAIACHIFDIFILHFG